MFKYSRRNGNPAAAAAAPLPLTPHTHTPAPSSLHQRSRIDERRRPRLARRCCQGRARQGTPTPPTHRKGGRWWGCGWGVGWCGGLMGGESKRKNTEEGGEAVRTGACSQKGQADCLCPNMLAFSKLTWQRRYFPWSRRRESKTRPRPGRQRGERREIHSGYQPTAAPLLHCR